MKKTPRFLLLTLSYAALIQLSYLVSLLLRFEGDVPGRFWVGYLQAAPIFTVLTLIGYYFSGLYHGLWRYASTVTLFQIVKGATLSAISMVALVLFMPEVLFPRSMIVMVWASQVLLVGAVRFAWRMARDRVLGPAPGRSTRSLIVGADTPGVHLVQEMRRWDPLESTCRHASLSIL